MTTERDIERELTWLDDFESPRTPAECIASVKARVAAELVTTPADAALRQRVKQAVRAELRGPARWSPVGALTHLAAAALIALVIIVGWAGPASESDGQLVAFDFDSGDTTLTSIENELADFEDWHDAVELMLLLDDDDALQNTLEETYFTDGMELTHDPA